MTNPFALTVIFGIAVLLPNVPGTPVLVFTVFNVSANPTGCVPSNVEAIETTSSSKEISRGVASFVALSALSFKVP